MIHSKISVIKISDLEGLKKHEKTIEEIAKNSRSVGGSLYTCEFLRSIFIGKNPDRFKIYIVTDHDVAKLCFAAQISKDIWNETTIKFAFEHWNFGTSAIFSQNCNLHSCIEALKAEFDRDFRSWTFTLPLDSSNEANGRLISSLEFVLSVNQYENFAHFLTSRKKSFRKKYARAQRELVKDQNLDFELLRTEDAEFISSLELLFKWKKEWLQIQGRPGIAILSGSLENWLNKAAQQECDSSMELYVLKQSTRPIAMQLTVANSYESSFLLSAFAPETHTIRSAGFLCTSLAVKNCFDRKQLSLNFGPNSGFLTSYLIDEPTRRPQMQLLSSGLHPKSLWRSKKRVIKSSLKTAYYFLPLNIRQMCVSALIVLYKNLRSKK
jgi:hypothetical protein